MQRARAELREPSPVAALPSGHAVAPAAAQRPRAAQLVVSRAVACRPAPRGSPSTCHAPRCTDHVVRCNRARQGHSHSRSHRCIAARCIDMRYAICGRAHRPGGPAASSVRSSARKCFVLLERRRSVTRTTSPCSSRRTMTGSGPDSRWAVAKQLCGAGQGKTARKTVSALPGGPCDRATARGRRERWRG